MPNTSSFVAIAVLVFVCMFESTVATGECQDCQVDAKCNDGNPCTVDLHSHHGCVHEDMTCDESGECSSPHSDDVATERCEASRVNRVFWTFSKETNDDIVRIDSNVVAMQYTVKWFIIIAIALCVLSVANLCVVAVLDIFPIIVGLWRRPVYAIVRSDDRKPPDTQRSKTQ